MKKEYKSPTAKVLETQMENILAGSLLSDKETQTIKIENEFLDGNDIEVY
ncbi:MAG: hypothetical protein MJZ29_06845 [Bacteroidaceae bacterium]|nr:hypothetical protein [Bacteroidaceae bacterium]